MRALDLGVFKSCISVSCRFSVCTAVQYDEHVPCPEQVMIKYLTQHTLHSNVKQTVKVLTSMKRKSKRVFVHQSPSKALTTTFCVFWTESITELIPFRDQSATSSASHSSVLVSCPSSSALRWWKLSSHTLVYSPGTAEPPGCLLGCWDSAHLAETEEAKTATDQQSINSRLHCK